MTAPEIINVVRHLYPSMKIHQIELSEATDGSISLTKCTIPGLTLAQLQAAVAAAPESYRLPIVKVPAEIANWRAKAVLELAGLTAQVAAIMGAMSEPQKTVVLAAWDGGAPLVRNGATVTALAAALSLTSEQVDAMFVQAAALNV